MPSISDSYKSIRQEVALVFQGNYQMWLDLQDIFFSSITWPQSYVELFRKPNKDYSERFRMFLFFYGNGITAAVAGKLTLLTGENYDISARRHVKSLVRASEKWHWIERYQYPDGYAFPQWKLTRGGSSYVVEDDVETDENRA